MYVNKKLSYRRETARQLRTSFSARSLIVHFTVVQLHCVLKNAPTLKWYSSKL